MLVLDPSTGVEWTPAKKKTWKERIASTLKAYEFVTRTICGDSNYPQEGGLNHPTRKRVSGGFREKLFFLAVSQVNGIILPIGGHLSLDRFLRAISRSGGDYSFGTTGGGVEEEE
ncbi:hypothetical protein Tco_1237290 [Tanacetum coccineum]